MDYGHVQGDKYDDELNGLRNRFEELLGNANGYYPEVVVNNIKVLTTLVESGGFPLLYDPFDSPDLECCTCPKLFIIIMWSEILKAYIR